jgi:hypothetical protein
MATFVCSALILLAATGRKIILVEYRGPADPDTDGSYAVKRYHAEKVVGDHPGELRASM